ncbi:uncharacterized protein LOC111642129 [Centruroides sculpturatus]|uniref:uncharacterized protein LOC111642129 n=1 Tax=Centruroides sculpturatus TaxID=218467 RepID=UPI000C6CB2AB|nr:uncharacterized protein LOC111642129 [Centruroides sculpturatus]
MADKTVKPNLYLPPSISPVMVAKLVIQILECKRSSCKCKTSKEILNFAMKILLSEDDSSLYSDYKFRTITKFFSCAGTKNVATQTRRWKRNSCTIQTDLETVIPKKSISVYTEKTGFKLLQSKIKQRISNGSTKSVSTQANSLEFVNCFYNRSNSNSKVVAATNKLRRVTITEGMPLQGNSAEVQKIQHLDECFFNWAPRQACPGDPSIKLRCENVNLDYRNPKRDISHNNAELPLIKKQKMDYDPTENELFSSRKAEEIRTLQSATPEFSPASTERLYDSIKLQENNINRKLEKHSCFYETVSEATSREVNKIKEKLGIKYRICSESFQHSYLRLNNEKTNHVLSNKVFDLTERQHLRLSPERLNSPSVFTISSISLNQQSENLNKIEDFDSKCSNFHKNESFFNDTKSSLKKANFINVENGEKTQSMLPYKMEYCINSCKLDKNTAKVQKEVTKDSSSDDYLHNLQHGVYLNERQEYEQTLQNECSPKDVSKVSYQKLNTLNCKRDSQNFGISERNIMDKESIEVYSPTDELSMCSDMEVSYTPPVHPLLNLDSDKNAAADAEKATTVSSKELHNFDKISECTTQDIIESVNAKPDQQKEGSEMIQNYAFMNNWMKTVARYLQCTTRHFTRLTQAFTYRNEYGILDGMEMQRDGIDEDT